VMLKKKAQVETDRPHPVSRTSCVEERKTGGKTRQNRWIRQENCKVVGSPVWVAGGLVVETPDRGPGPRGLEDETASHPERPSTQGGRGCEATLQFSCWIRSVPFFPWESRASILSCKSVHELKVIRAARPPRLRPLDSSTALQLSTLG